MKYLILGLCLVISGTSFSQGLTVEKIMRDPKWIGTAPSNIVWSADSRTVYFQWNPVNAASDSTYKIALPAGAPVKVEKAERRMLPNGDPQYSQSRTKIVFEKYGDIFLTDLATKRTTQITNTGAYENNPFFSKDERKIFFTSDMNLFSWELGTGKFMQYTDFKRGKKNTPTPLSEQEKWLRNDQLAMFQVLKEREEKKNAADKIRKSENPDRPKEIYLDDKTVDMVRMSPDEKFVTFRLTKQAKPKNTIVPNYVTTSGFTEDINGRTKVGAALNSQELFIYDVAKDTVLQVVTADLEGITDKITFKTSTPAKDVKEKKEARQLTFTHVTWSEDGSQAAVVARSVDNKDRWISILDPKTRKLKMIERLHDDAWVGPFLGWSFSDQNAGWMDNRTLWFLSEETGYSHLYVADMSSGTKKALTTGKYEVQNVQLSSNNKTFYLTTNEVHPGEKHFYKLPVGGGKAEKITTMTGAHEVEVSPDEKMLAFRYSASTKPWELFIMENKAGAKATQVTSSLSDEFKSYQWKEPELVTVKARDNLEIWGRLYKPKNPNGAAVIFVHGAGYLQNAHKWWSSYFREYMFHNLLADQGYTVLDLDYRASAGYGRDWRTGIYQFMGGKDLTDNIDGAKFLVDQHNVDPKRIGIYGGSYGGFITLMGLFTTPDVFAAGAALRPVTDWAHYNHGYTANILNTPVMDSLAYAKSSPIYYAEGLKGALLICHGMVDVNVHFQDVVRLQQRLIELGKDNWEVAAYPMEDHGFVEPSSWTDEYKRILKLFNDNLVKK
jgi:dipeptidyl aminopeptidase/acylaminoacyl peptidase